VGSESVQHPAQPGAPLRISARTWNALQAQLAPHTGAGSHNLLRDTSTVISVRNDTSGALDRFAVVAVGDPAITLAANPDEFLNSRVYTGEAPTATSTFAITQTPLAVGAVGQAVLLGETNCLLAVNDEADTHAKPGTSTADLDTATSGPALILWKEAGTGSGKKAKVLLTGSGAEPPSPTLTYGNAIASAPVAFADSPAVADLFDYTLPPGTYHVTHHVEAAYADNQHTTYQAYMTASVVVSTGTATITGEASWTVGWYIVPTYMGLSSPFPLSRALTSPSGLAIDVRGRGVATHIIVVTATATIAVRGSQTLSAGAVPQDVMSIAANTGAVWLKIG
jgi:hypothetical protein